jgi:hypothetical protein
MAAGQSGAEEGQSTARPMICAAGVPAAEVPCVVDPGTSVLEGSDILANWVTDIGSTVGGGGSNKAKEAEDVLGTITSSGGSSGTVVSMQGG